LCPQVVLAVVLGILVVACGRSSHRSPIEPGYVEPVPAPVVAEAEEAGVAEDSSEVDDAPSTSVSPSGIAILSATVTDLVDRIDLTATVSDLVDAPAAVVPDVIGLSQGQARTAVVAAGFVPYFVDTFPPTGASDRVFRTYPDAGQVHQVGANLFIEVDGPRDGILAHNGDTLLGVLNGQQLSMNPVATVWTITIWLDKPLAFDGLEDEVAIGREVRVFVDAGDVSCSSDGSDADIGVMTSGTRVAFVLDREPDFDIFAPMGGRAMTVDCQPNL